MLDLWPAASGHYAEEAYQAGFCVLAILQLAGFLLLALGEKPKPALGTRRVDDEAPIADLRGVRQAR